MERERETLSIVTHQDRGSTARGQPLGQPQHQPRNRDCEGEE